MCPWAVPLPRRRRLAGRARPAPGVRASRMRGFADLASPVMVLTALVITGLLLGGYPGMVILPAVTCLFLVSNATSCS